MSLLSLVGGVNCCARTMQRVQTYLLRKQHKSNCVANDETLVGVASELRIGCGAERREQGDGFLEVGDRKVDEELPANEFPLTLPATIKSCSKAHLNTPEAAPKFS